MWAPHDYKPTKIKWGEKLRNYAQNPFLDPLAAAIVNDNNGGDRDGYQRWWVQTGLLDDNRGDSDGDGYQ